MHRQPFFLVFHTFSIYLLIRSTYLYPLNKFYFSVFLSRLSSLKVVYRIYLIHREKVKKTFARYYLYISRNIIQFLPIGTIIYLLAQLSIYLDLSIYLSFFPSIYISIYLSIYIYLYLYLSFQV